MTASITLIYSIHVTQKSIGGLKWRNWWCSDAARCATNSGAWVGIQALHFLFYILSFIYLIQIIRSGDLVRIYYLHTARESIFNYFPCLYIPCSTGHHGICPNHGYQYRDVACIVFVALYTSYPSYFAICWENRPLIKTRVKWRRYSVVWASPFCSVVPGM